MPRKKDEGLTPEQQFEEHVRAEEGLQVAEPQRDLTIPHRSPNLTQRAASVLGCDPKHVFRLLRQVWKPPKDEADFTDDELAVGLSLVARYGLDPMTKEIYVARHKGRLMTIVGVDGWIKVVLDTPGYDGFETEIHFDENKKLEWVEVRIFSKRISRPTVYRAYWSEYSKLGGFVAGVAPSHMLRVFAFRHAARLFTSLGGSVILEDELTMMRNQVQDDSPKDVRGTRADAARERMARMTGESSAALLDAPQDVVLNAVEVSPASRQEREPARAPSDTAEQQRKAAAAALFDKGPPEAD